MPNIKPNQGASPQVQQLQTVLIRRKEVERRTALSRSRLYALIKADAFPKPVVIGIMSVAWVEAEVENWINSRIAESRSVDNSNTGNIHPLLGNKAKIAERKKLREHISKSCNTAFSVRGAI